MSISDKVISITQYYSQFLLGVQIVKEKESRITEDLHFLCFGSTSIMYIGRLRWPECMRKTVPSEEETMQSTINTIDDHIVWTQCHLIQVATSRPSFEL